MAKNLDQGGGGGGVGTVGEPDLCVLGAKGEPTAWPVGGSEGKPDTFGAGVGGGGAGTKGEPFPLVSLAHHCPLSCSQ